MKGRAVFLDRDGVINTAPPPGSYITHWEDFHLIPQTVDWIRLFNTLGLLTIVVTNQRCVDLGLISAAQLQQLHERMRIELLSSEARLDDIYVCPHGLSGCDCRKPQPGMVLSAARKWDLSLADCLLIGDSENDRELARRSGVRFIQVDQGRIVSTRL